MSREAYRTFVSFIFAAAMVAWGATLFGLNPLAVQLVLEETGSKNIMGLQFIAHLPVHIRIGGILYGIVLICFYWIYSERVIPGHLSTNIWVLPVDLIALSFMAAAAVAWVDPKTFIFLAGSTLVFLTLRFGEPALKEHKDKLALKKRLMSHLILVYVGSGSLMGLMLLGGTVFGKAVLGEGNSLSDDQYIFLYSMVLTGMGIGILVTITHAWSNPTLTPDLFPHATTIPIRKPSLTPCYDGIPCDQLSEVADAVLKGETRFRELLGQPGRPPVAFHLSRVHSYRDVETQAFIMAHHSFDAGNRAQEMSLRSMWVYLAHWFDDIFDCYYVEKLASLLDKDTLSIEEILDRLDPRFREVWENAVSETAQLPGWQPAPLRLGMQRLMLGGPMLSPKCANAHFQKKHKVLIQTELQRADPFSIASIVGDCSDQQLTYTSKVVVEIWDSFCPSASFPLSFLMDLFYAPALLAHDNAAETEQGELADSLDNHGLSDLMILDRVSAIILQLPYAQREWMLKPLPIFVGSFKKHLEANNRSDVLAIYTRVLEKGTTTQERFAEEEIIN